MSQGGIEDPQVLRTPSFVKKVTQLVQKLLSLQRRLQTRKQKSSDGTGSLQMVKYVLEGDSR